MSPRFQGENFKKNMELVKTLESLAKEKHCTSGQLTLAWLMAQGDDILPIPGTTKVKNFDENVDALKIKLSKEENAKIREAVEKAEVVGGRYPEALVLTLSRCSQRAELTTDHRMMASLFADTPAL